MESNCGLQDNEDTMLNPQATYASNGINTPLPFSKLPTEMLMVGL